VKLYAYIQGGGVPETRVEIEDTFKMLHSRLDRVVEREMTGRMLSARPLLNCLVDRCWLSEVAR